VPPCKTIRAAPCKARKGSAYCFVQKPAPILREPCTRSNASRPGTDTVQFLSMTVRSFSSCWEEGSFETTVIPHGSAQMLQIDRWRTHLARSVGHSSDDHLMQVSCLLCAANSKASARGNPIHNTTIGHGLQKDTNKSRP